MTGMSDMPRTNSDLMAAQLARLAELESDFSGAVERAKLAALKEFAYGASHEINNPLANISTRAQALLAEEKHPERRKKLATIAAQAMRAHEMISDLMLFAKPPPLELADLRLADLIGTMVGECAADAAEQKTRLSIHVEPPDLVLRGDGTQLGAALKALVRNALEALGEGGLVEVHASSDDQQAMLSVTDDGPGIPPQVREHIFDPFYSGREAGRGLGFGLPKCWRIAQMHGGSITVESEPVEGTTFRLVIPRNQTFSPR